MRMRCLKVLLLTTLVLVSASVAGADPVLSGPNALGLYFDGEAAAHDVTIGGPATLDAYLIFTDPTIAFINGWEVKVTISVGSAVTAASFPQGTTVVMNGPADWTTTMAVPMPCNALTKLAVFSISSDAQQNTFIYLGAVDGPSVASDLPAVRLQDGSWSAVPVSSGDATLPVASINSSTPNDNLSWGSVKSLFR